MGFTMYKSGFMHFWDFYHNPTNIFIPSSGSVCWDAVKVLSFKTTLFLPSWERDVFENLWCATLIKSSIRLPTSFLLLPVFFLFVCFSWYNSVVISYNSFKIGNSYQFYQFSSVQLFSCVWLFVTPWTAPRQASLSITTPTPISPLGNRKKKNKI